jgi:hypothetical protein
MVNALGITHSRVAEDPEPDLQMEDPPEMDVQIQEAVKTDLQILDAQELGQGMADAPEMDQGTTTADAPEPHRGTADALGITYRGTVGAPETDVDPHQHTEKNQDGTFTAPKI